MTILTWGLWLGYVRLAIEQAFSGRWRELRTGRRQPAHVELALTSAAHERALRYAGRRQSVVACPDVLTPRLSMQSTAYAFNHTN